MQNDETPNIPENNQPPTPTPAEQAAPQAMPGQTFGPTVINPQANTPGTTAPAPQPQMPQPPQPVPYTPLVQQANPQAQQSMQPPQPAEPTQAVIGGIFDTTPQQAPPTSIPLGQVPPAKKSKKKFVIAGAVGAFLLLAVSAFTFLYYIPNTPNQVWANGLTNTGKEADAFLKTLSEPDAFKSLEKNQITVKGTAEFGKNTYSINADSKVDATKSDSGLSVSGKDESGKTYKLDAKVKTVLPDNATFPNIYFMVSGLTSLGLDDAIVPGASKYENKWIAVEQDFFKQFLGQDEKTQDNKNITQNDVTSVLKDINTVAKEYVFTNNPKKAVIEKTNFVATEKSEGITANHYKAKLNAENVKSLCKATVEKLSNNASFKRIVGSDSESFKTYKEDSLKSCDETETNTSEFDIWFDKKFKIIHKVRNYEDFNKAADQRAKDKVQCLKDSEKYGDGPEFCSYQDEFAVSGEAYTEYGQVFNGKDQFMFFAGGKATTTKEKSDTRIELTVNTKTLKLGGKVTYTDEPQPSGDKTNVSLTITTEPFTGDVNATKPAGAIPLQQVLDALNLN